MDKRKIIIVDADAIVAGVDLDDVHHKKVIEILGRLLESEARLIYPRTAIVEAVTVIQRVLGKKMVADKTAEEFVSSEWEVVGVSGEIYSQAVEIFKKVVSKKDTLFDCVVAAVAKKYKADAVFSFDKFYKKLGLKLVSDLKW